MDWLRPEDRRKRSPEVLIEARPNSASADVHSRKFAGVPVALRPTIQFREFLQQLLMDQRAVRVEHQQQRAVTGAS
jgi:hypothetical protein